jgi:hypothetical protein
MSSFNYYIAKQAIGSKHWVIITPGYFTKRAADNCCYTFNKGLGHKFTFEVWDSYKVENYQKERQNVL